MRIIGLAFVLLGFFFSFASAQTSYDAANYEQHITAIAGEFLAKPYDDPAKGKIVCLQETGAGATSCAGLTPHQVLIELRSDRLSFIPPEISSDALDTVKSSPYWPAACKGPGFMPITLDNPWEDGSSQEEADATSGFALYRLPFNGIILMRGENYTFDTGNPVEANNDLMLLVRTENCQVISQYSFDLPPQYNQRPGQKIDLSKWFAEPAILGNKLIFLHAREDAYLSYSMEADFIVAHDKAGSANFYADVNLAPPFNFISRPYQKTNYPSFDGFEYRGTLGPYEIGLYLALKDYESILSAHYFYSNYLTDIPLIPKEDGNAIELSESGGGVFQLTLIGGQGTVGQRLDFYNSIGLQGTWSNGKKTYPVKLVFGFGGGGSDNRRWYEDVTAGTNMTDQQFEAIVRRFIRGVLTGNRAEAASAVSYPVTLFHSSISGPTIIADKASFLAHWNEIFTPSYIALLRADVPHEMFVHDDMAMLGRGEAWFDAKGFKQAY
jgi:hypothetical protein